MYFTLRKAFKILETLIIFNIGLKYQTKDYFYLIIEIPVHGII